MSMLNKLKQFKDMRSKAKELQGMLSQESATGNSSGVVITLDGTFSMSAIAIDDSLLSADKKEKLQQSIKDAHKDAISKLQRSLAAKMKDMPGMPTL